MSGRRLAVTADRDRYRVATAAGVMTVAAIAAVVSFLHIRNLALTYGQSQLEADLLPLSIDGVVATTSLVMLRSARAAVSAPWLARTGLVLSVVATLAANVASGLPHGWHGALVACWPPVGFVISAEVAISMSRRRPSRGQAGQDKPAATVVARASSPSRDGQRPRPQARKAPRASAADTEAAVLAALAARPDMTHQELADEVGVSTRTARRYRSRLAMASR